MSSGGDKKTASQTDGKAAQTKKSDMGMGMMAYKVKQNLRHIEYPKQKLGWFDPTWPSLSFRCTCSTRRTSRAV